MFKQKKIILISFLFLLSLLSMRNLMVENKIHKELAQEVMVYIDDVIAEAIPSKTDNVIFDEQTSTCNHGATVIWDYEDWGPVVINGTTTKTKCNLRFKTGYKESLLNGTDPVLKDELIPVTIENDGMVKKADLSEEWYKYENQRWANAIILKDESTKNNYKEKDVIPEEAIESYFVWIPRYRYKIFNEGNYEGLTATVVDNKVENKAKIIEVVFENNSTPISNGSKVGEWLTHPAFTSFNSNGMWVGKFETSKSNDKEDNSINPSGVEIKPNVTSWRSIQVSNAFYTSYNYKRNLNSHMMKNMEWGAIAYLQHSNYGSHTSIRMNNNSDYKTGYAAKVEPTCGYTGTNLDCNKYCNDGTCNELYNTSIGYLASTTGNITGIYDMSGGAHEYVMIGMLDSNGNYISGRNNIQNSGFIGTLTVPDKGTDTTKTSWTLEDNGFSWPNQTYYDLYQYASDPTKYNIGILGDATKEMGPFAMLEYENSKKEKITRYGSSWYDGLSYFAYSGRPWFIRGGSKHDGLNSGIFAFYQQYGGIHNDYTFRVVLTP